MVAGKRTRYRRLIVGFILLLFSIFELCCHGGLQKSPVIVSIGDFLTNPPIQSYVEITGGAFDRKHRVKYYLHHTYYGIPTHTDISHFIPLLDPADPGAQPRIFVQLSDTQMQNIETIDAADLRGTRETPLPPEVEDKFKEEYGNDISFSNITVLEYGSNSGTFFFGIGLGLAGIFL